MKKTTLALALMSLLCVASAVMADPMEHSVTFEAYSSDVTPNDVNALSVIVGDTVNLTAVVKKHGSWIESWGWTDGVTGTAPVFNGVQYIATGEYIATTVGTFDLTFDITMGTGVAGVNTNGNGKDKTTFVIATASITIVVVAPPADEEAYVTSVEAGNLSNVAYTLCLYNANNANSKNAKGAGNTPQQGWGSIVIPFVVTWSNGDVDEVSFVVNFMAFNRGNNMSATFTAIGGKSCTVWMKAELGDDPDSELWTYGGVTYECYELCFASVKDVFGAPVEPTSIKFPNTTAVPFAR